MRDRNRVCIDRVAHLHAGRVRSKVRNDLVAIQIEVDPLIVAASLFTFQHAAIKLARSSKVVNWKRKVEKIVHDQNELCRGYTQITRIKIE